MNKNKILFYASALLFCAISYLGFVIAVHKPFWADETHYLNYVGNQTLQTILFGSYRIDPNSFPLFHLIEYTYTSLLQSLGIYWYALHYNIMAFEDIPLQIFERIPSNLSVSFAIAFSFYFYSRHFSPVVGILVTLASLSVFPVWYHIAETRPYAIWYLLATLQVAYLLGIHSTKGKNESFWNKLIIVQFFMCIFTVFSIFHIFTACAFLWLLGFRQKKKYYIASFLQALIWSFYYFKCEQVGYFFSQRGLPHNLILANFKPEHMFVLLAFLAVFGCAYLKNKSQGVHNSLYQKLAPAWPVSLICLVMFVFVGIALVKFNMMKTGKETFEVSNRYFFHLSPLSSASFALIAYYGIKALNPRRFLQVLSVGFIVLICVYRIKKTYGLALSTWF